MSLFRYISSVFRCYLGINIISSVFSKCHCYLGICDAVIPFVTSTAPGTAE